MLIRSRRAIAIALFVVLFPQLVDCHHTVQRDVATLNAPGEKALSKEEIVGVTTLTGQVYEFRNSFPTRLQNDTIFGVVGDSTRKFACSACGFAAPVPVRPRSSPSGSC